MRKISILQLKSNPWPDKQQLAKTNLQCIEKTKLKLIKSFCLTLNNYFQWSVKEN